MQAGRTQPQAGRFSQRIFSELLSHFGPTSVPTEIEQRGWVPLK
jgi:hypothetical protein